MDIGFVCEACCESFSISMNTEWEELRDHIPEEQRGIYFIANKDCQSIPRTWEAVKASEHLILYKEKNHGN